MCLLDWHSVRQVRNGPFSLPLKFKCFCSCVTNTTALHIWSGSLWSNPPWMQKYPACFVQSVCMYHPLHHLQNSLNQCPMPINTVYICIIDSNVGLLIPEFCIITYHIYHHANSMLFIIVLGSVILVTMYTTFMLQFNERDVSSTEWVIIM